jgi:hypothetical protein
MKRKAYIQPQMTTVILKMHSPLLTISRLENDEDFVLNEEIDDDEEDH